MQQRKLPVVLELERMFAHLNGGLFDGSLPAPTHVVQPDKKVVFRFVTPSYHVIIGSKFTTDPGELACHYLHNMVHMANHKAGLVDCTSNQYHNKNYLNAALAAGMHVQRHKTQGWCITSFNAPRRIVGDYVAPPPDAEARRREVVSMLKLDADVLRQAKKELRDFLTANKPKPCFLKYICQCPPPHNSIRSGRRPDGPHAPKILCQVCRGVFQFSEN
jgi:hypothetical protein